MISDLELRRAVEIHEIEERKNQHINELLTNHQEAYPNFCIELAEIIVYFSYIRPSFPCILEVRDIVVVAICFKEFMQF